MKKLSKKQKKVLALWFVFLFGMGYMTSGSLIGALIKAAVSIVISIIAIYLIEKYVS